MPYVKGQSGNPAGKRLGTKNRKTLLRAELEKDGSALAAAIKAAALDGDSTAQKLWLDRLEPALKAEARRVNFELDPNASYEEQAKSVLLAVSQGELDVDAGKVLMDMIVVSLGFKDMDAFLKARSDTIKGGVKSLPMKED